MSYMETLTSSIINQQALSFLCQCLFIWEGKFEMWKIIKATAGYKLCLFCFLWPVTNVASGNWSLFQNVATQQWMTDLKPKLLLFWNDATKYSWVCQFSCSSQGCSINLILIMSNRFRFKHFLVNFLIINVMVTQQDNTTETTKYFWIKAIYDFCKLPIETVLHFLASWNYFRVHRQTSKSCCNLITGLANATRKSLIHPWFLQIMTNKVLVGSFN